MDERILRWEGIWWGFVGDLMREWGYLEIRELQDPLDAAGKKRVIEFFEKMQMLYSVINLANAYSSVLSSRGKPDPNDIQLIGRILEQLGGSPVVEELKSNIREYMERYP